MYSGIDLAIAWRIELGLQTFFDLASQVAAAAAASALACLPTRKRMRAKKEGRREAEGQIEDQD